MKLALKYFNTMEDFDQDKMLKDFEKEMKKNEKGDLEEITSLNEKDKAKFGDDI